jgi:hypothetical protein
MTELVKAEALCSFARLIEVDGYFNLDLFSFLLVHHHHLDVGGCENFGFDSSRIQIAADEHVSDPWRLPLHISAQSIFSLRASTQLTPLPR